MLAKLRDNRLLVLGVQRRRPQDRRQLRIFLEHACERLEGFRGRVQSVGLRGGSVLEKISLVSTRFFIRAQLGRPHRRPISELGIEG